MSKYLSKDIKISDIKDKCNDIILKVRCTGSDTRAEKSKKFFKKNGFYFEECWNLDKTIAAFILPRLIYFKETHSLIPNFLVKENNQLKSYDELKKEWNKILQKMIEAFYRIVFIDEIDELGLSAEQREINEKMIKEGLKLFAKYFEYLWD